MYLNAVNLFLMFVKFLHYLRVSDRVMVLERTLASSARALLSVVVLLCLFVLAYTIAGTILFGPHLFGMRNIQESWTTLFRTLIGSFDYDAMNDVSAVAAAFFDLRDVWFVCVVELLHCHFDAKLSRTEQSDDKRTDARGVESLVGAMEVL